MRGCDQPGLSPVPRNLLIPHELEEWDGVGAGSLPGDDRLRKLAGQDHLTLQVYCLLRFPCRMGPIMICFSPPFPFVQRGCPMTKICWEFYRSEAHLAQQMGRLFLFMAKLSHVNCVHCELLLFWVQIPLKNSSGRILHSEIFWKWNNWESLTVFSINTMDCPKYCLRLLLRDFILEKGLQWTAMKMFWEWKPNQS